MQQPARAPVDSAYALSRQPPRTTSAKAATSACWMGPGCWFTDRMSILRMCTTARMNTSVPLSAMPRCSACAAHHTVDSSLAAARKASTASSSRKKRFFPEGGLKQHAAGQGVAAQFVTARLRDDSTVVSLLAAHAFPGAHMRAR